MKNSDRVTRAKVDISSAIFQLERVEGAHPAFQAGVENIIKILEDVRELCNHWAKKGREEEKGDVHGKV